MRRIIVIAIVLLSMLPIAYSEDINIYLPDEQVTIDGRTIDNNRLKYPIIMYNETPYLPVTWSWAESLGLITGYSQKSGLFIASYDDLRGTSSMVYGSSLQPAKLYKGSRVNYPVTINGALVEEMLINYNDVTYLPLTNDFARKYFGWAVNGINIDTDPVKRTGEKEFRVSSSIVNTYKDRLLVRWTTEEKHIKDGFVDRISENYTISYASNDLTFVDDEPIESKLYNSGKIEEKSEQGFREVLNIIFYNNKKLIDLRDFIQDEEIANLSVVSYDNDHGKLMVMSLRIEPDDKEEKTKFVDFLFIEKDDKLVQLSTWPMDQHVDKVYAIDKGYYVASDSSTLNGSQERIDQGVIGYINNSKQLMLINDKYQNYNNMKALGTDSKGNLYLCATWGKLNLPEDINKKSLVYILSDGFFVYTPKGLLNRIGDFKDYHTSAVSPDGQVYITVPWRDDVYHIQTKEWILPKGYQGEVELW